MRVLVLINSLYTGGAEFSTLLFYQWMKERGHEVSLVCLKEVSPSYNPSQFGFEKVTCLKQHSFWQNAASLMKVVEDEKPEIIHSVLFDSNLLGRFIRLRKSLVHMESLVNESYSSYRLKDPNVSYWKLEAYRWLDKITQAIGVDHFHANGQAVANHYHQKLGIHTDRVTVIPRGRNPNPLVGNEENRISVRQQLGTDDRIMIICVGRHEFQKGHDVLMEAMQQLGEVAKRIQLILAGREGNYTANIMNKVREYGLGHSVKILGHRDDVNALLAAADVFVFPSRMEGLPGALIEAEAASLPIVCTSIANNLEVVSENENALLCEPEDHLGLAKALKVMIGDKALRQQMGTKSLQLFKARFSLEEVHLRMERLIQNLVQENRQ